MIKRLILAIVAILSVINVNAQSDTMFLRNTERPIYFDMVKGIGGFDMIGGEVGVKYVTLGITASKDKEVVATENRSFWYYNDEDTKRLMEFTLGGLVTSGRDRRMVFMFNPSMSICNYGLEEDDKVGMKITDDNSFRFNLCGGVSSKAFNFQIGITHLFKENNLVMKFGFNVYTTKKVKREYTEEEKKEAYINRMKAEYGW